MKSDISSEKHCAEMLFYDTNFFRALLRGDFHNHLEDLESDLRVAMKLPFTPWRTPFAVMEWIGLNSDSLPIPKPFNPAVVAGIDFIGPAYRHYESHYATVRELDRQNLEALSVTQRGRVCPRMVAIWDNALGGIFDDHDVSGWLRYALCFDAVHKLEVAPSHRAAYWSDLIGGAFFGSDMTHRNLSKFRLAYQIWHVTRKTLTRSGVAPDQRKCVEEAQKLLKLKNSKDYLDGDLVHLAAYGIEDPEGTRHRVVCFTCDRPEVVIMRIRLYKAILSNARELYREKADAEGFPTNFESSHNGEVLCFDFKGNLVRRIDVASETPALSFPGKGPS